MDKYTVAEGSTALFTQVRCQTPGILARGQSKCYCNTTISENLSHLSVSVVFRPFVFFNKLFYRLINHEAEVEGLVGLIKEEVQTDQSD